MRYLASEVELSNEQHVTLGLSPRGNVLIHLLTVDIDLRRFTKLQLSVNPNDINEVSTACGQIMTAAYGKPDHDVSEWSQLFKAIGRFKVKQESTDGKRQGESAAAPAGEQEAIRGELGQDLPKAPPASLF